MGDRALDVAHQCRPACPVGACERFERVGPCLRTGGRDPGPSERRFGDRQTPAPGGPAQYPEPASPERIQVDHLARVGDRKTDVDRQLLGDLAHQRTRQPQHDRPTPCELAEAQERRPEPIAHRCDVVLEKAGIDQRPCQAADRGARKSRGRSDLCIGQRVRIEPERTDDVQTPLERAAAGRVAHEGAGLARAAARGCRCAGVVRLRSHLDRIPLVGIRV